MSLRLIVDVEFQDDEVNVFWYMVCLGSGQYASTGGADNIPHRKHNSWDEVSGVSKALESAYLESIPPMAPFIILCCLYGDSGSLLSSHCLSSVV